MRENLRRSNTSQRWAVLKKLFALPILGLLLLSSAAPLASAKTAAPAQPRQVAVGLYINDVSEYDQNFGSFSTDFYLWFRWTGNWTAGDVNATVASAIATAALNPADNYPPLAQYAFPVHFELMNGEVSEQTLISAQPDYNKSGYNLLEYRIRADMHDPITLTNYPLDVQTLTIEMEDSFYPNTSLVYVADNGSELDPSISAPDGIPGWTFDQGSFQTYVTNHFYNTSFGYQPISNSSLTSSYSRYIASFTMRRPFASSVSTLILPVAIIVGLTIVSFFIDPEKFEERLALLVTSVLSAVLLQVSIDQAIPATGQFTLADRTMLVVYAVLAYGLAVTVVQKALKNERHPRVIVWLDRVTLVILPIATTIAIAWLFFSVCDTRICSFNS